MLQVNMDDVLKVVKLCVPYLIGMAVAAVIIIAAMVAVRKKKRAVKYLVRRQGIMALVLVLVITVNLICWGPMSNLISLATGSGRISEETSNEAAELCAEIAEEGIVLLKNDDNLLPLKKDSKLNVFGWASTNPCYGGTGSGSLSQAYETVTLLQGLEHSGFQLNTKLSDFYTAYRTDRPKVEMWEQDWTLPEPAKDSYSSDLINDAKAFSDTAMIVISRVGGEGADLPTDVSKVNYTDNSTEYNDFKEGDHYLKLSQTEKDMVDLVCSNFDNVVFVYNGANAMELGFLKEYSQIKSAIWCPGTGQSGFEGLGKIISGEVNPSAKTSDTFLADLTKTPTFHNFGDFAYSNMDEFPGKSLLGIPTTPHFVNYVDSIYVGYRFYETAAEEGLIDYDKTVVYPFGYGLSYTTFKQEMGPVSEQDGKISFDVTVTNTGNTAGKDVVEVYYNPPYYNGGIEKASANLIAFDKTEKLEPGASETIPVSFDLQDMASYDADGKGAYVLEAGDYGISVRSDSHTIIGEQTVHVSEEVVYDSSNPRTTDHTAATNQFEQANGGITYLSRANGFSNYEEATKAPATDVMPEKYKKTFINNINYNPEDYNNPSDVMPKTGAKNGLSLADMRGLDYDDPKWEPLLDQLTVKEMDKMVALGGYQTPAAKSVKKVGTVDCDGPASINNNFTRTGSIGFPSAVMIACTWNQDMAEAFGESIGKMADEMKVSGWYAPAMNLHRSAFAGRNFEYFSEDGVLSGRMSSSAVKGAEHYGVYAYIKHFALNDQETNRERMLCTWADEQAIREIYLKPFEIAVKEGKAKAVMSAFNYIGTVYAGAYDNLLNKVLRDEWGFRGFVITDYFGGFGYQNADQEIRNGNDTMLVAYDNETNHPKDTTSATSVLAMRQACKNMMYTIVNSRAYEGDNAKEGLLNWQIAAIVIDLVLAAGFVALQFRIINVYRRKRQLQEGEDAVLTERKE